MHLDENKKFDKRNIERNLKDGLITKKDYENYLAKLPDVSDKVFSPEEEGVDWDETSFERGASMKKKWVKKSKGRGK